MCTQKNTQLWKLTFTFSNYVCTGAAWKRDKLYIMDRTEKSKTRSTVNDWTIITERDRWMSAIKQNLNTLTR